MEEESNVGVEPKKTGGNREVMSALLQEYEGSPMTVKTFCRSHDIKEGTFYYWRKRLGNKESNSGRSGGFLSVEIKDAAVAASGSGLFAEVDGIRIYRPVAAEYLKALRK